MEQLTKQMFQGTSARLHFPSYPATDSGLSDRPPVHAAFPPSCGTLNAGRKHQR